VQQQHVDVGARAELAPRVAAERDDGDAAAGTGCLEQLAQTRVDGVGPRLRPWLARCRADPVRVEPGVRAARFERLRLRQG
jgi:hypothetical protein